MMSESQEVAHGALNAARGMLHRFDPKPGDGATIAHLYDRDAGTVISVSVESNHVYVVVQEDAAVRTESSDLQTYAYTPNPEGRITTFRRKVSRPPTLRGAWKCCWRDPGRRGGTTRMSRVSRSDTGGNTALLAERWTWTSQTRVIGMGPSFAAHLVQAKTNLQG